MQLLMNDISYIYSIFYNGAKSCLMILLCDPRNDADQSPCNCITHDCIILGHVKRIVCDNAGVGIAIIMLTAILYQASSECVV